MNRILFDTETTGLDENAEIIEIAMIDIDTGEILINERCRPVNPCPIEAERIHGITNKELEKCANWETHYPKIKAILDNCSDLFAYNISYDMRLLDNTNRINDLPQFINDLNQHCVMLEYAEKINGGTWARLVNAAEYCGINEGKYKAHSALGDCMTTLEVMQKAQLFTDHEPLKNDWLYS